MRGDLPTFMCIGAQKAGTTWLFAMLRKHPDVYLPAKKEIHFWDMHYAKGIEWYRAHFRSQKICGDITPAYALLNIARIAEIASLMPALRLIYILRNPIERAWSAALMNLRALAQAVEFEGQPGILYEEVKESFFIRQFNMRGNVIRGDYVGTIRRWLSVFPREQLLILRFEEIARSPKEFLRQVCEHVGIRADVFLAMPEDELATKVFASSGQPIPASLHAYLALRYESAVRELEDLLGWDLSGWYGANAKGQHTRDVS